MKRQHTYERIIGEKLNGLTPPNVAGLWENMEAILDREMPRQEEKKRPLAWWLNANLLVAAGLFVAVGSVYTFCRVAGKQPVPATVVATTNAAAGANKATGSEQAGSGNVAAAGKPASPVEAMPAPAVAAPEATGRMAFQLTVSTTGFTTAPAAVSKVSLAGLEAQPVQPEVMEEMAPVGTVAASTRAETAGAAQAEVVATIAEPLKEASKEQAVAPAFFHRQPVNTKTTITIAPKTKTTVFSDRGFSAGLAALLPVAMGPQQKLALDMHGRKNNWQDLMPAVYAQYHLSKKFYLQAEWQPVAAQYTPNFTLYDRTDVLNPDEKQQKIVKLNKLFYTNIPVSFHYNTPVKNLTVGIGAQYSKLKRVVLQDQEYYYLIGAGGVFDKTELKNEVVVKDPEAVRGHTTGDVVDSVASAIRREDWRLTADVAYRYKTLQLGVRYSNGINHYINTNFTNLRVKDRHQSLQFYLRVNLFDSRKKSF